MEILILVVVVLAALGWGFNVLAKKGRERLHGSLAEKNRSHGTAFPTTDRDYQTYVLGMGALLIAFDTKNQKVCVITNGTQARVFDYSYIRGWQLHWVEKSHNGNLSYTDVHFQISTSNVNCPTLRISVPSKRIGEDWNNRLGIIFN